jgi:hypothetical protein
MFYVAPRLGFTPLELGLPFARYLGFSDGQSIPGINLALRFDKDAVLLFGERHKVPFSKIEGFKDFAGDDNLAALSDASDPLLSWRCLCCHAFRVYDGQKMLAVARTGVIDRR